MNVWAIISVVIAAVGIIITAVHQMLKNALKKGADGEKINGIDRKVTAYEEKHLNCERRFVQLEERKTDNQSVMDIHLNIRSIKQDIDSIKNDMSQLTGKSPLAAAHSPIKLTEAGKTVAEETDMFVRINSNWNDIVEFLNEKINSDNPYDIQQACFDTAELYPEKILKNDDIDYLKDYAFKNGQPLSHYSIVMGIIVRDKYFAEKKIPLPE